MSAARFGFRAAALVGLALTGACGGPGAKVPEAKGSPLAREYADAFALEATASQEEARTAYLALAERAAAAPEPEGTLALAASLDALVFRYVAGLGDLTTRAALIDRTRGERARPEAERLTARLEPLYTKTTSPIGRHLLARALLALAEDDGDATRAARFRGATGCASAATVLGATSWTLLSAVRGATPRAPGEHAPAFSMTSPPVLLAGRGCALAPMAATSTGGTHLVGVEARVPRAQRLTVVLRARTEAAVVVAGQRVLHRPYELGASDVIRYATVPVAAGNVPVVVRAGVADEAATVELSVLDERGEPVTTAPYRTEADALVAAAEVRSGAPGSFTPGPRYEAGPGDADKALAAAGALALGDPATAERALHGASKPPRVHPMLALLYARSVDGTFDLPAVDRAARARTAYERVLEAWPGAWEAILGHAMLAGARRGPSEARLETLRDLEARRAAAHREALPLLDAFDAAQSGLAEVYDRARAALDRAREGAKGAPLVLYADRVATPREGKERVAFACDTTPPRSRASFSCYDALRTAGALDASMTELARLRQLFGQPAAYAGAELRDRMGSGDRPGAKKALARFLPAERNLATLYALDEGLGPSSPPEALRKAFEQLGPTARDAPAAFAPLLRAAGDDPLASFARLAEERVADDRKAPLLNHAATAILAHEERYDVSERGILHGLVFDVRRVTGTTDVEQNAQADAPFVEGRTAFRTLRRRIFKKDGRILTPERTPGAQQAHADLTQLEAGDAVETAYELWALPGETGDLTLDTPDLLPDRTAVYEARIEVRLPPKLPVAVAAHASLGKVEDRTEAGARLLRWTLKRAPTRRIEAGTPKMDGAVAVSLSTARWADLGLALRETLLGLDEASPEVDAWARGLAAPGLEPVATLQKVVEGVGAAIKESSPADLTDAALGRPRGAQVYTARTMLASRQGSRTWLLVRALRTLGVAAEVLVAESEPFSADPKFPPHFGRFSHPLALVHLPVPGGGKTRDVWVDADVPGAPLPPGHLTPSVQGRTALREDGSFLVVPNSGDHEADDIALDLTLDEQGDAAGTFTATLRGREAQEMGDAFARVVGFERQRALTNVVLGWVPYATVDDVNLASTPDSWEVVVKAKLHVFGYAEREGKTLYLPGTDPLHYGYPSPWTFTLGATFAGQGGRTSALAVNDAQRYRFHRRIHLPKGAVVDRIPVAADERSPQLAARRTATSAGGVVDDELSLDLATGTVDVRDYQAFVARAHRIDDAFGARVRLRLP